MAREQLDGMGGLLRIRAPEGVHSVQLRAAGLRPTPQRQTVLQVFEQHPERAMSPEDVMRVLMEEGSKTSLGSVYRQVRELEQAGLLCKVWLAGRTGRRTAYQLNTGALPPPRLLLVCAECQVNLGPASDTLRAALAQLLADQGWAAQPLSVQIECPSVSRCGHGLKTGAGRIPEPPAA